LMTTTMMMTIARVTASMSATTSMIRRYWICPSLLPPGWRQWSRTTGEGTHVHDKRSTIKEISSRQQWGHITANVFPPLVVINADAKRQVFEDSAGSMHVPPAVGIVRKDGVRVPAIDPQGKNFPRFGLSRNTEFEPALK
jgi:hypothetical protein